MSIDGAKMIPFGLIAIDIREKRRVVLMVRWRSIILKPFFYWKMASLYLRHPEERIEGGNFAQTTLCVA